MAITAEDALRSLYSAAFIGGATITGGPAGGATATAILASPAGKYAMDQAIAVALGQNATPMAMGGLVDRPTIALLGEAGPEMVVPLTSSPKKKRKVSKYQKQFGKELKILKRKHPRTPVTKLMAKAHAAARRTLGMPRRRRA
tara:strand:- start:290 stop:718 length:429 start_codon:yes stop_codon:yes gene_type:complete